MRFASFVCLLGSWCWVFSRLLFDAAKKPAGPRGARSLILTPTRELAIQIADSFRDYGKHLGLRHTVVYGGVGQNPQVDALARGVDILVATPGRLLDLMNQGFLRLDKIEIFVLDEADRMLDMGFIHDIRKVIGKLPKERQTLFFSATMPPDIARLAASILRNPVEGRGDAGPPRPSSASISVCCSSIGPTSAPSSPRLLKDKAIDRVLVLQPHQAWRQQGRRGSRKRHISAEAIHGNKSQSARQRALENFRGRQDPRPRRHRQSRRAASTSTASPMSSISTCRTSRKAMSIASAAPRAPAPTASPSRSATARSAPSCATSRS